MYVLFLLDMQEKHDKERDCQERVDRLHRFGHTLFAQRRLDPHPGSQQCDERKNANGDKTGNFFIKAYTRQYWKEKDHMRE